MRCHIILGSSIFRYIHKVYDDIMCICGCFTTLVVKKNTTHTNKCEEQVKVLKCWKQTNENDKRKLFHACLVGALLYRCGN